MSELMKAIRQCKKGVGYKDGPNYWYLHGLTKAKMLKTEIQKGKYKLRPGVPVQIFRPKKREAIAPWFRDRVWQRSMCNNGVYHDLTRSLAYDNVACQKEKGTDLAIRRTIAALQKIYRETGSNEGWGVHRDVRKYFPSTPHSSVKTQDRRMITEPRFIQYLDEIVDSIRDPRTREEIRADPFGERGTGLGSQINQLNQVALLNRIDHELITFCKHSQRYMDDFLILDKQKGVCMKAGSLIDRELAECGLTGVDKSGIFKLSDGFYFLRHYFKLTETGKVIVRLHPGALKAERNALRGMKRALDRGEITMDQIKQHYQCFISQAEYTGPGDGVIRSMDKFYTTLFRQRPAYKRKRRYFYGNPEKSPEGARGRAQKK